MKVLQDARLWASMALLVLVLSGCGTSESITTSGADTSASPGSSPTTTASVSTSPSPTGSVNPFTSPSP